MFVDTKRMLYVFCKQRQLIVEPQIYHTVVVIRAWMVELCYLLAQLFTQMTMDNMEQANTFPLMLLWILSPELEQNKTNIQPSYIKLH